MSQFVKVEKVIKTSVSSKDGKTTSTVVVSMAGFDLAGVHVVRGPKEVTEGQSIPYEVCRKLEGQVQNLPTATADPLGGE